jgi:hypothetical protein
MSKPKITNSDNKEFLNQGTPKKKEEKKKEAPVQEEPVEEVEEEEVQEEQPMTLDEKIAYQKIKNKILKWKASFPKLTEIHEIEEDMNYEELVELERLIAFTVGSANSGAKIQSGVVGLATIMETKAPSLGFNLEGFSKTLMTNEDFRNTLLEIECVHSGDFSSPYGRLLTTMIYSAGIVHLTNSARLRHEMQNKKVDEEKQKEYSGL